MGKTSLLLIVLFVCFQGIFSNHQQKLYEKLVNVPYYNTRVRPVLKDDQPIIVKHGIVLTEISDINEKQQKMIVNALQRIEWKDELLHWNTSDYGGIKEIHIEPKHFWVPRLLLYNNADANYPISRDDVKTRISIKHDGEMKWIVPGIFKSSCTINVQYFPLDEQFCSLRIGSWTYGTDKLDIQPVRNQVDLSMYSQNGQWDLVETWAHRETLHHSCCTKEVAQISYDIHIKRLPLFYITNFILPCALIAALNAMVFLTPAETGEQLAVGVTILLSLVVFFLMVESRVPNTSDHLPLISKYYCCTVIEISAVLAFTCIIHKFEHHEAVPLPPWVQKYIVGYMGKLVFMKLANESGSPQANQVKQITVSERTAKVNILGEAGKPEKKGQWGEKMKKKSFRDLLQKKAEQSPFEGNKNVEIISNSMKEDEKREEKEMQWKHAANILARFMTIVYIFAITVTFFATFFGKREYKIIFPKHK